MATTRCAKCGGARFELKIIEPSGARYKQAVTQCAACGTAIGISGYYDAGAMLDERKSDDEQMRARVGRIESIVTQIAQFLNRRG